MHKSNAFVQTWKKQAGTASINYCSEQGDFTVASLLPLITFSFFFFFYCCVSCCLSRSHLEKHLQREGIAAHTHFSFQHLCSDESEFYSFADMSRKKSFTLFLNLKICGELSSYSEMSLCCSNHSSFPALVNVVHALMHILHKLSWYL